MCIKLLDILGAYNGFHLDSCSLVIMVFLIMAYLIMDANNGFGGNQDRGNNGLGDHQDHWFGGHQDAGLFENQLKTKN